MHEITTNRPNPNDRSDKIIVRLIVTSQLLASFVLGASFFFSFMYGGASAWPTAFARGSAFFIFGGVSAILLYSRTLLSRVLTLLWHLVIVSLWVYGLLANASTDNARFSWIPLWSALCFSYLALTSVPAIWIHAKHNPKVAGGVVLAVITLAIPIVGLQVHSGTQVGLENQLRSTDPDVQCAAARRIGDRGPAAKSALPALRSILDTTLCVDSGEFADDTAEDIEKVGGIEPLIEAMKDRRSLGRAAAAWQLKKTASEHPEVAGRIKQAFKNGLTRKPYAWRLYLGWGISVLKQPICFRTWKNWLPIPSLRSATRLFRWPPR